MSEKLYYSDRSLLTSYVEKLTAAQSSVQELQVEMAELRQDARTDGFNMEAVQALAQIIAKSPHDGGLSLLHDVIKYAREIGMELDTVTVESDLNANGSATKPQDTEISSSRYRPIQVSIDRRLVALFQLGLGLGVAWMFISLLR